LNRVIEECRRRLADPDAYDYEVVDLESEFRRALEKKGRELDGTRAVPEQIFSPGARFLLGRGEAVNYYLGERGILYAMDFEGNESHLFTEPGRKIEAQQMDKMLFLSYPTLTDGLNRLLDPNDKIPELYGFDYFLCGRDILLRGTEAIRNQIVDIIRSLGVEVSTLHLDDAWLIYEPTLESSSWPYLSDYHEVNEYGAAMYWVRMGEGSVS